MGSFGAKVLFFVGNDVGTVFSLGYPLTHASLLLSPHKSLLLSGPVKSSGRNLSEVVKAKFRIIVRRT